MTQQVYVKLWEMYKPVSRKSVVMQGLRKSIARYRLLLGAEFIITVGAAAAFFLLGNSPFAACLSGSFAVALPLTGLAAIRTTFSTYYTNYEPIIKVFSRNHEGLRSRIFKDAISREKVTKYKVEQAMIIADDRISRFQSPILGNPAIVLLTSIAITLFNPLTGKIPMQTIALAFLGSLVLIYFALALFGFQRSEKELVQEFRSFLLYAKMEMEEQENMPPKLTLVQSNTTVAVLPASANNSIG